MYVSLNEMYLCELVHALKINKAELEEVPRNKSIPSAPPPPPHVAKLPEPHTNLPLHFLGTRRNLERRLEAKAWGTPHPWGWGSAPEAVGRKPGLDSQGPAR